MPDENGYPTKKELKTIRAWDVIHDPFGLIDYLKNVWWYGDTAIKTRGKKVIQLELHTLGWSGNEDIIEVLHKNLFFMFYWERSLRGGHYYFKVKRFKASPPST